jgi:AcrR family transcriptional regulator
MQASQPDGNKFCDITVSFEKLTRTQVLRKVFARNQLGRGDMAIADSVATAGGLADLIPGTTIPPAPSFIDLLAGEAAEAGLRKGERTRRRVLWATASELAVTRFAALNMDQIAKTADVSRAALYQYVGSKDDAVRTVLTDFQSRTIAIPLDATRGATPQETILRTNRYYIDYFAKNAAFMERVRELHDEMPELTAEKQRVNREWADRLIRNATRHGIPATDPDRLRLRAYLLECMVDDALRELFVIGNADLKTSARTFDMLAEEITRIWFKALYET